MPEPAPILMETQEFGRAQDFVIDKYKVPMNRYHQ